MPEYELACRECGARTEILAPYAVASALELVCVSCGGTMTKAITHSFQIATGNGSGRPAEQRPSASGHAHHRHNHGAVKLTRPNPFMAPGGGLET